VTPRAATVLSYLAERLVAEGPYDMKALEVVERWRSEDERLDKDDYSFARTALVKIMDNYGNEFRELINHDDLALRKGYYSNIRSTNSADVFDGFEKDGSEFLDAAIYNDSFFTSEETRNALSRACWDAPDEYSRMDYPNIFNARVEYLSARYPEWFKDGWSGDLPFDKIKSTDERLEKRLEYLNNQVAELHKALIGDKDKYQDSNEFSENNMHDELRLALQQIREHLGKLYQKSSFPWGWLVGGVALGLMLGKY
jgi:hypothetical protein